MKRLNQLALLTLTLSATGCVHVPEAYFGTFTDAQKGATLTLSQSKAELDTADGRHFKASGTDLSFDQLAGAKAGIYDLEDKGAGVAEVYWVNPVAGSRQENAGFVWYQSEVVYTYLVMSAQGKVPSVQVVQCASGTVMLDTQTKRIEIGCPEGPTTYNLTRTK